MDWDILPLEIILGLQSLAVIGVFLILIAESYHGEASERRSLRGRRWTRESENPRWFQGP